MQEQHRHAADGQDRAADSSPSDAFLVDDGRGRDQNDRRDRHYCGGDTRLRVSHGHQRQRHADERPQGRAERRQAHPRPVPHRGRRKALVKAMQKHFENEESEENPPLPGRAARQPVGSMQNQISYQCQYQFRIAGRAV